MEHRGRIGDWQQLREMVMTKFDKDQYQIMLRQLDSLKQTASVLEYQEEFEKLAHGVLLYNPAFDDTFFVTRFVGGLKEEIQAAVLLHRPQDVDTASALARIQEQELASARTRAPRREFTRGSGKTVQQNERWKNPEPEKTIVRAQKSKT